MITVTLMLTKEFYLLTDTSIICSYLVSKWIDHFEDFPHFRGILVKEEPPSTALLQKRKRFHAEHAGKKQLTAQMYKEITSLYPSIDETEHNMISLFGISRYSTTEYAKTFFLGNNVNETEVKNWLVERSPTSAPFIFTCVNQILKPWWIAISNGQLFNVHSAVLPYGPGVYAIENLAALRDIDTFTATVGFTIHYINEGIDSGPIIRAERIIRPFQFDSIWALKGFIYVTEFEAYVKTAREILSNEQTVPAGIKHDPSLRRPISLSKNFTPAKRKQAEDGYLAMKETIK
jgi:phosphoribosylglycinamide formyltransferase-1